MGIFYSNFNLYRIPGMSHDEQAGHQKKSIELRQKESALISDMTNDAFDVSDCIELIDSYPGHYYSFPETARLHPLVWRHYVHASIAEPEGGFSGCPDHDILAFMDMENIGFTGGQLSLLYLHGPRFYSNHPALFMGVIMQDMRKKKTGVLTFKDLGHYYLNSMKSFLSPNQSPMSIRRRDEYRMMFDEFNAHFHYIFRHYPLGRFAACAQSLEDWDLFSRFYGCDELLKFKDGRRFLLEHDMGM
jgi:hypothetical protein